MNPDAAEELGESFRLLSLKILRRESKKISLLKGKTGGHRRIPDFEGQMTLGAVATSRYCAKVSCFNTNYKYQYNKCSVRI